MKRFGQILVGSEFKPLILSPVASRAIFPARPVEVSGGRYDQNSIGRGECASSVPALMMVGASH
jgi:hypothetical protein